jgi:hypothetical protein
MYAFFCIEVEYDILIPIVKEGLVCATVPRAEYFIKVDTRTVGLISTSAKRPIRVLVRASKVAFRLHFKASLRRIYAKRRVRERLYPFVGKVLHVHYGSNRSLRFRIRLNTEYASSPPILPKAISTEQNGTNISIQSTADSSSSRE